MTASRGTYDAAFTAKDTEKLAASYQPDATIDESVGVNNGWADYRDRPLGPGLSPNGAWQSRHSRTSRRARRRAA